MIITCRDWVQDGLRGRGGRGGEDPRLSWRVGPARKEDYCIRASEVVGLKVKDALGSFSKTKVRF